MSETRPRMNVVVVATDFSPGAASAAERAALLPLAPGATIHLVHVLPDSMPAQLVDEARRRAASALGDAAADLRRRVTGGGAAPVVEHALLAGKPYVELIRFARLRAADLMVVGRHAPGALRGLLGTTAERVVRKGDVPVLLVNEAVRGPYSRPLVALDLSETSRRETDLASALLPDDAPELALVHAYHVALGGWIGPSVQQEYRREVHADALRRTREVSDRLQAAGLACRAHLVEGEPRMEVLRLAVEDRADLLVLGTHARAGISHALLGSVAEWLVRSAPCDVAVTRPARFTFEPP